VAITAPVPRPPHRFWRCCDRWMTLSRHPGPCPDLAPLWSEATRVAIRLFARRARRRVTADARPDLGPRSLDPDRTFWCAFAECIWSQASPVDFCNCLRRTGTEPGALTILAGTSAVTPFLLFDLPRPLPCGSGDRRRAAHRPFREGPGAGSSWLSPGFPDRDTDSNAPPPRVAPTELQWRSTCTGQRTKTRTRICRSTRGTFPRFSCPVHALRRVHADDVPLLSDLWTSVVAGASPRGEETRSRLRTEPRPTFRR